MPVQFDAWQQKKLDILSLTSSSLDLSEEDRAEILYWDNGDWDDEKIVHWCTSGCKCRGDVDKAKSCTKGAIMRSLGSGCPLALEYRWKHMEKAQGWICRLRKQHNILELGMRQESKKKELENAERQIQQQVASGSDDNVGSAKRTVKVGKVLEFMENDKDAQGQETSLVLCKPAQKFMNIVFHSEKLTNNFVKTALFVDDSAQKPTADAIKLEQESFAYNWRIVSGCSGKGVGASYIKMLRNYSCDGWTGISGNRASKFTCALSICRAIGLVSRRLVLYFEQPKFLIFGAVDPAASETNREAVKDSLQRKHMACSECVDSNTVRWLDRLSQEPSRAIASLVLQLASSPVSSVRVEQKHLFGQESRKVRSRGRALGPSELMLRSYQKSVAKYGAAISQAALDMTVPKKFRIAFSRHLLKFEVVKRRRFGAHKKKKLAQRRLVMNKLSGLDGSHREVKQ